MSRPEVSATLRHYVMRALLTMTPKCPNEIWWDVWNDYGTVSERQVYRALAYLYATRSVRRVRPDGSDSTEWGYMRRRRRFRARSGN